MRSGISWRQTVIMLILAGMLFLVGSVAIGQQASAATALLKAGNYAGYLAEMQSELRLQRYDLAMKMLSVAIALTKTQGWDADTGQRASTLLKDDPKAQQAFEMVHTVLNGDLRPLPQLCEIPHFSKLPPEAGKLLHEHGFPLAGNAFLAISSTTTGPSIVEGATAWLRVPQDQRNPVTQTIEQKLRLDWQRLHLVGSAILQLYRNPPAPAAPTDPEPQDIYQFFLDFGGRHGLISITSALELCQSGKRQEGIDLALRAGALQPDNLALQMQVANVLPYARDRNAQQYAFYAKTMRTVPEPFVRHLRRTYLQELSYFKREELAALTRDTDRLVAADALFISEKIDEAEAIYCEVFADRKQPLERRIAAWPRVLQLAPETAFAAIDPLLDELAAVDADKRGPLMRWLGNEIAGIELHYIGKREPNVVIPVDSATNRVSRVEGWAAKIARIADRLLDIDTTALLQPDEKLMLSHSLRQGMAQVFALSGEWNKALEVLEQPIDYTLLPPDGGWPPDIEHAFSADSFRPRTFHTPKGVYDVSNNIESICRSLSGNERTAEALIAGAPMVLRYHRDRILADRTAEGAKVYSSRLVWITRYYLVALDKTTPPETTISVESITPVREIIDSVLEMDRLTTFKEKLLRDGLQPALIETHTPTVQETIYNYCIAVLKRVEDEAGPAVAAREADILAKALETIRDEAKQTYARQLRDQFPLVPK